MAVSIILVAYNSRHDLERCLPDVICQLAPEDELIVVDNASQDGSGDYVVAHFPQVRLVRETNLGYAGGNNRGAALARGDYLVFLNPDTRPEPGAIATLVAPLITGEADLTTPCLVYMDNPELVNTCGNTVHYTGLTYCRGAGRLRQEFNADAEVDAISGAAFAIRRTLFLELGGFDEQFFMYVEDTDLSWRARLAGYTCRYVAGSIIAHDYAMVLTPHKAFYLDRNRHIMLLKNLERRSYLRLLPGLLLGELVTTVYYATCGSGYLALKPRVYRWLWRHRRAIRTSRRQAQALRRHTDALFIGRLTHRLDFGQVAGAGLGRLASYLLDPLFLLARPHIPGAQV